MGGLVAGAEVHRFARIRSSASSKAAAAPAQRRPGGARAPDPSRPVVLGRPPGRLADDRPLVLQPDPGRRRAGRRDLGGGLGGGWPDWLVPIALVLGVVTGRLFWH